MSDRHEARILLELLAERWERVEELCSRAAPDPERLIGLARDCGVHPWLHRLLAQEERFDLVGDEARARLDAWRHKCRMDNLLLLAYAERALDCLLEAGIVPVVLKGLDSIHRFELGFDARTMDDMDILVREERLEATLRALEASGWRRPAEPPPSHWAPYHIPMTSAGPVKVVLEVHWDLVQTGRYRVDNQAIFDRALPLQVAGREVLGLDVHDYAAYLLLHHMSHYFERGLKWALDFKRLVETEGFEWDAVAERLEDWGGLAAGGYCLRHMRKLFPALVPDEALERLRPAAWRGLATLPLRSGHPLDLFRGARRRLVQFYLGVVLSERPWTVPGQLLRGGGN